MCETINCNFCYLDKPAEEFKKTSGKKCRSCRNAYMKEYLANQKNPKPQKQQPQIHGLCSRKTRARMLLQRNPKKPIDRELYVVDNKTWRELDNLGWMNFDRIMQYKMEELTVEYWEDFHYKMQQQALSGGRYGDWIRKDEIIF